MQQSNEAYFVLFASFRRKCMNHIRQLDVAVGRILRESSPTQGP